MSFSYVSEERSGVVVGVNGVDASGLGVPSQVSYEISLNLSGGVQVFHYVVPRQRRPSDIVKLVAAKPGDLVRGSRIGDEWYFTVVEWPDMRECGSTAGVQA